MHVTNVVIPEFFAHRELQILAVVETCLVNLQLLIVLPVLADDVEELLAAGKLASDAQKFQAGMRRQVFDVMQDVDLL